MISKENFMDITALYKQGISMLAIARKLGIDRRTVKKHLFADEFPKYTKKERKASKLDPYKDMINKFLEEDNYKSTWILEKLRGIGYTGGYTILKDYVSLLKEKKTQLAYVRFETEPGRQAQVDWGHFQVVGENGKSESLVGFVMVLGYSRGMYVEFVENAQMEAFLDCHIHAFRYLKGITNEILYDNMKTVVVRKAQGQTGFNPEFMDFARHYGFLPRVCPIYSPWVKGKVEKPVDYIRERFWRGYRYSSLQQANSDVKLWLDSANTRIHGTHHQRIKERWDKEIINLQPLPLKDYDTSSKLVRHVFKDCQFSYNGNRYVVPHRAAGKKVMLKIKGGHIQIYHDAELLASYQEPKSKGELIQDPRFYEELRKSQEQCARKYPPGKGKAVSRPSPVYVEVEVRSINEYQKLVDGGQ